MQGQKGHLVWYCMGAQPHSHPPMLISDAQGAYVQGCVEGEDLGWHGRPPHKCELVLAQNTELVKNVSRVQKKCEIV